MRVDLGEIRSGSLLWILILFLLLSWVSACASGPAAEGAGDPNMISTQEVENAEVNNAYELIERLRPMWLRSRGGRSTRLETEIVVYLNRSMLGGPEALRDIPIEIVQSVRVMDAAEAGRLPGLGSRHVERAILVETGGEK
jgi:hypothetical protein